MPVDAKATPDDAKATPDDAKATRDLRGDVGDKPPTWTTASGGALLLHRW
jgi:hypothetical protein